MTESTYYRILGKPVNNRKEVELLTRKVGPKKRDASEVCYLRVIKALWSSAFE